MGKYLIRNALIINEGQKIKGNIQLNDNFIEKISRDEIHPSPGTEIIEAEGLWLIPGIIDDQVHFREPGLTHKADIKTESMAAAAGGVTSFMEMPNTIPQTTSIEELNRKFELAAEKSCVNYSFYLGATNDNIGEIKKVNPAKVCGIKVFMGSSTGNMLVDKLKSLEAIFSESPILVATHCEDEFTIQKNAEIFRHKYGDEIPVSAHPLIRNTEACFKSSSLAVSLAEKYNTRLHVLHISTSKELELFRNDIPATDKRITSEVCVHHLWFNDSYYPLKGSLIKWNPAIKTETDRRALFEGVLTDKLDVIATDHAPHSLEEKQKSYFHSPSGAPMVQHSLSCMLEFVKQELITIEKVVDKMCHKPAEIFNIEKRGFLREGYYADLVLVNPVKIWKVEKSKLLYKCGWSPLESQIFTTLVKKTFVNGEIVYNEGELCKSLPAMPLSFKR